MIIIIIIIMINLSLLSIIDSIIKSNISPRVGFIEARGKRLHTRTRKKVAFHANMPLKLHDAFRGVDFLSAIFCP